MLATDERCRTRKEPYESLLRIEATMGSNLPSKEGGILGFGREDLGTKSVDSVASFDALTGSRCGEISSADAVGFSAVISASGSVTVSVSSEVGCSTRQCATVSVTEIGIDECSILCPITR